MTSILDNLDVFFTRFGVEATFDMGPVTVIFDNNFLVALEGVETSTPAATIKTSEVLDLGMKHKDQITINEIPYQITGIQHDGTGMTVLLLENIE
jgi:molecular chaperone GrpE (heat shock protein)